MKKQLMNKILYSIFLLSFILFFTECKSDGATTAFLKLAAEGVNKQCPITLDEYSVLEGCKAMPNKTLQYTYSVDTEKLAKDMPLDQFKATMRPNVVASAKSAPDMKELREREITLEYIYNNLDGTVFLQFKITPEDYK